MARKPKAPAKDAVFNIGPYERTLDQVLMTGAERADRTGTGTIGVFGLQTRYDLSEGKIPLVTTKRVYWKAVVTELLWMLRGETNVKFLHDHGITIWDEWADSDGNLGPIYGSQWRSWRLQDDVKVLGAGVSRTVRTIDQIANVIQSLKDDPFSRRHLVTAWNPGVMSSVALPPCHCLFQFYSDGVYLDCQLYQRSADMFLGVPFNIASYALLTAIIAAHTGLIPREFIHTIGDAHIYANHRDQVVTQLSRSATPSPTLKPFKVRDDFHAYLPEDFQLDGYDPHPPLPGAVSV